MEITQTNIQRFKTLKNELSLNDMIVDFEKDTVEIFTKKNVSVIRTLNESAFYDILEVMEREHLAMIMYEIGLDIEVKPYSLPQTTKSIGF